MSTRILVTDEADDEHYTLECNSGDHRFGPELHSLTDAARIARHHAVTCGHTVEITAARVGKEGGR